MAKKRSEMTPVERLDWIMAHSTWDEAETVGVEILARCLALHTYAREDGKEFYMKVMSDVCRRAGEWAKENSQILAFAHVGHKLEKEKS